MKSCDSTFIKSYRSINRLTQFNEVKLSPTAKNIYFFMASLHSSGLEIYPTLAYLAEEYGVGRKAVVLGLEQLHKSGLISSIQRMDNSKVYTLLLTPEQIIAIVDKTQQPPAIEPVTPEEESPKKELSDSELLGHNPEQPSTVIEDEEPEPEQGIKPSPKPKSKTKVRDKTIPAYDDSEDEEDINFKYEYEEAY